MREERDEKKRTEESAAARLEEEELRAQTEGAKNMQKNFRGYKVRRKAASFRRCALLVSLHSVAIQMTRSDAVSYCVRLEAIRKFPIRLHVRGLLLETLQPCRLLAQTFSKK